MLLHGVYMDSDAQANLNCLSTILTCERDPCGVTSRLAGKHIKAHLFLLSHCFFSFLSPTPAAPRSCPYDTAALCFPYRPL
jgi:hypothetical protein